MGIPAKLNSIPEGSRTPLRAEGEHHRSEATLAFLIFRELFDFVNRNLSERSGGDSRTRGWGCGARGGIPLPCVGTGETLGPCKNMAMTDIETFLWDGIDLTSAPCVGQIGFADAVLNIILVSAAKGHGLATLCAWPLG
jgi:hypothetical protein